jgi:LPXTG-motif cell wall-anchored protein
MHGIRTSRAALLALVTAGVGALAQARIAVNIRAVPAGEFVPESPSERVESPRDAENRGVDDELATTGPASMTAPLAAASALLLAGATLIALRRRVR